MTESLVGSTNQLQDYLVELEGTAEELLAQKSEIIQLDKKRNDNRVGLRHLIKTKDKTSWLVMGNTFFRFETKEAKKILEEDQRALDQEINTVRKGMSKKMDKMRDLEGRPPLKGFNLKPLNNDEVKAIYQTIGK